MLRVWKNLPPQSRGIALICAAILMFSIMDAVAKGLSQRYPPTQVVWARYASQTFWSFLLLAPWLGRYLRTNQLGLHLIRSTLLFGSTFFFFSGFRYLQLTEMTAIFQVAPLLITLMSVLFLREKVGTRRWWGVGFGLAGALIIIRPGTDVFSLASLLPLLAAASFAGYSITTRSLGRGESPMTSFLFTTLIGTLVASLLVPWNWVPVVSADLITLSLFGCIGGFGHLMLIYALMQTEASVLAPFTYFSLLYNTLWGFAFFAEVPDLFTLTGAFVIVAAGLYVWRREVQARRRLQGKGA